MGLLKNITKSDKIFTHYRKILKTKKIHMLTMKNIKDASRFIGIQRP